MENGHCELGTLKLEFRDAHNTKCDARFTQINTILIDFWLVFLYTKLINFISVSIIFYLSRSSFDFILFFLMNISGSYPENYAWITRPDIVSSKNYSMRINRLDLTSF